MAGFFITMHDVCHFEIHRFLSIAASVSSDLKVGHFRLSGLEALPFRGVEVDGDSALEEVLKLHQPLGLGADDALAVVLGDHQNLCDRFDDEYFNYTTNNVNWKGDGCIPAAVVSMYWLNPQSTFMREAESSFAALTHEQRRNVVARAIYVLLLCTAAEVLTDLACHEETRGCVMDYCQRPMDMLAAAERGCEFCDQCVAFLRNHKNGAVILGVSRGLTDDLRRMADPRVFLSYAREDRDRVEQLYDHLKAAGMAPWMDTRDLLGGQLWATTIAEAIDHADCFVPCLSTHAVNKVGVLPNEYRIAFNKQMTMGANDAFVIPVRFENVPVPGVFGPLQWVDISGPEDYGDLVKAIRKAVGGRRIG